MIYFYDTWEIYQGYNIRKYNQWFWMQKNINKTLASVQPGAASSCVVLQLYVWPLIFQLAAKGSILQLPYTCVNCRTFDNRNTLCAITSSVIEQYPILLIAANFPMVSSFEQRLATYKPKLSLLSNRIIQNASCRRLYGLLVVSKRFILLRITWIS